MKCRRTALIAATLVLSTNANAAMLNLISGVADPSNTGPVPVPTNAPIPLPSTELSSISDSNLSTGYAFTSSQGSYSSDPDTVIGFGIRYDFDVSAYQTIDEISFTWTGLMSWSGTTFPDMRLGPATSIPQVKLNFGTNDSPNYLIQTGTINFYDTTNFYFDISRVLDNGVASFWASTDLGISCKNCVDDLTIQTLEVSAQATGTLKPVPLPASAWLLISGLACMGTMIKRKSSE